MPIQREVPRSPIPPHGDAPDWTWLDEPNEHMLWQPTTPDEQHLRELIQDALDRLDDVERFVFDAWVVERLSFAEIAVELEVHKSSAWRTKERAVRKLRAALEDDVRVLERLKR